MVMSKALMSVTTHMGLTTINGTVPHVNAMADENGSVDLPPAISNRRMPSILATWSAWGKRSELIVTPSRGGRSLILIMSRLETTMALRITAQ